MELFSTGVAGARIWLSASIPEANDSTFEQRDSLERFVARFARAVFAGGGHIVHGAHPSIIPLLLREASLHRQNGGRADCLILVISRFWSKHSQPDIEEWRRTALVIETPEGTNREASLALLRAHLVARVDAAVTIGGRWWQDLKPRAGIPTEISLALERGLPTFILGGFGGTAKDYVEENPLVLKLLKNGLSVEENRRIFLLTDVAASSERIVEQLGRLPLVRGARSEGSTFRILTLDGGGIKGTFSAAVLATWEKTTGQRIVDHFDLIAGTSTGGILALGIGLELSGSEMLEFYRKMGPRIFPVTSLRSRFRHAVRHALRPKFSQEVLFAALEAGLYRGGPPKLMRDSKARLLIPSYHALAGVSHVFRTPHAPNLTGDADLPAASVALATAAAPTYFASAPVKNVIAETSFVDGGVWANNPALVAIVEAICNLNVPLERIDVLSIGTTEEPFTITDKSRAGAFRWGTKLVRLLLSAQEDASAKHARLLAGEPRFIRVNTMTVPGTYTLDGASEIEKLAALGNHAAMEPRLLAEIKARFLNGVPVSPWR